MSNRTKILKHIIPYRSTVYNLTYGPTAINVDVENGDENIDSISLYSLGDGVVFMHKAQRGVKPTNIEDIIAKTNNWERKAPSRSELVFQPVLQKFLGTIHTLHKHLKKNQIF